MKTSFCTLFSRTCTVQISPQLRKVARRTSATLRIRHFRGVSLSPHSRYLDFLIRLPQMRPRLSLLRTYVMFTADSRYLPSFAGLLAWRFGSAMAASAAAVCRLRRKKCQMLCSSSSASSDDLNPFLRCPSLVASIYRVELAKTSSSCVFPLTAASPDIIGTASILRWLLILIWDFDRDFWHRSLGYTWWSRHFS